MPGGVEVQSLKKRRQQSKKLKEKVNNMVTGGQNFLKAKLSVDCKYCQLTSIQYLTIENRMTQWVSILILIIQGQHPLTSKIKVYSGSHISMMN